MGGGKPLIKMNARGPKLTEGKMGRKGIKNKGTSPIPSPPGRRKEKNMGWIQLSGL